MNIDINSFTNGFNWDSTADNTAFSSSGFESDNRFYKLKKDKEGKGAALIRFLPDGDMKENGQMGKIFKVFKIHCQDKPTQKFVSEWSPSTIGEKDPFQEKFSELWNMGDKEGAKRYGRQIRFIANIKVINDTANPENNGKVFLFDMSETLANKVKNFMDPSPTDIALGVKPKQLFNPLKGYNFMLISTMGTNNIPTYENSRVAEEETSIYNSPQEAIDDITKNCYKLSEWLSPDAYKSYDYLKRKLEWFDNISSDDNVILTDNTSSVQVQSVNVQTAQTSQTTNDQPPFNTGSTVYQAQQAPQTAQSTVDDLDAMIAQLTK